MNVTPSSNAGFGSGPGLAATREAVARLGALSVTASGRGDAILRSLQLGSASTQPPFLATDEGNRALQGFLTAGLAWLGNLAKGAGPAAETAVQLALPLAG
jgi:hypothetical protein